MKSGLILAVLLGLVACLASGVSAEDPPKKTCFKLVKIDTPASHPDTDDGKSDIDIHDVVINPDGTIRSTIKLGKGLNYPGSIWTIDPKAGTASYKQLDPAGSAQVSFTPLPEYLCPDDHFTFSVDAKTQGGAEGGMGFGQGLFKDITTTGVSPLDYKAGSGSFTGRFVPFNYHDEFTIVLRTYDGSYGTYVVYHYAPTNETAPPKKPDPTTPQRCPDTFKHDWVNTTWGRFVIHVRGTTASGEYSNRDAKFGPGMIAGTVSGHQLEGTWKDANGAGTISLTLSDDGCTWAGRHTVNPDTTKTSGPISQPNPPKSGPPGDPCTDPASQQCVRKWLDKAMEIRNRRDKSNTAPGGPWHVSNYGNLLGHGVISDQPPEGWETKYHTNKYCYVWVNWQKTHLDPAYGGELDPLADFVQTCAGGPTPPITTEPPVVSRMTLVAYKRKVQAGETVQVPIWLLKGADVANMNFTVTYDPNVATVTGDLTGGYLLDGALFDSNIKTSGLIQVGFARTSGISGDGPVAYAEFKAVGKPGDRTPLTLAVTTINNTGGSVPAIDLIHGEILIVGPGGVIHGDCDGDGTLTAADAWCALQMSVGNVPVKMTMDMDGDGKVTSRDATLILQKTVGK